MALLLACLALVGGLALLTYGADRLISGASTLARRARLSEAVIGATIVAGGTSLPELVASLAGALEGQFGLALGNVVGSNSFNVGAILGPVALVAPLAVARSIARVDWWVMVAAIGLTCVVPFVFGNIPSWVCGIFITGWLGYVVWSVRSCQGSCQAAHPEENPQSMPVALAWIGLGIALLSGGGKLLVWGAVDLARSAGLSDALIGLTIVAAGTSMPELVTSLLAARRGQHQLAVANIVGSNTFNILLVLGATGLFGSIPVAQEILHRDLWWMLGFALVLPLLWGRRLVLGRIAGGLLLAGYLIYTAVLIRSALG